MQPNNIIPFKKEVKCNLDAFKMWLVITKAIHKLTDAEMDFMAALLNKRHEFSFKISDDELLDEYILSNKIRKEIQLDLNYDEPTRIPNLISGLKKKNVIKDGKINRAYIPRVSKDFDKFEIRFSIIVKDDKG